MPTGGLPAGGGPHMDRAFRLAERARGLVSPNPLVGCVVTDRDGLVVGEGWTQPPGQAHAEVMALAVAGERATDGTLYVTLEPCHHRGRTPPCTAAIRRAGIGRVVYAMRDPHEVAAGGGDALAAEGLDVVGDVAVRRARRQNEIFCCTVEQARVFVVLKAAMSLDGRISDVAGRSQWITGEQTRLRGHRVRAEVDAILVGAETALVDNPSLTVRSPHWTGPQPRRVVLDRRGRTAGAGLAMFDDGHGEVLVLAEPDVGAVVARLWDEGVRSVLVEGGPTVGSAFVRAGLVDRFELHYGNVVLGGGEPAFDLAVGLGDAARLELASVELCGDDVLVTAYPR